MTGSTGSPLPVTPAAEIDRRVERVREKATEFARLPVGEKAGLVSALIPKVEAIAEEWVKTACRAKGIAADAPVAGEEWLGGPVLTVRNLRLLLGSLRAIQRDGRPPLGRGARTRHDGRVEVDVFPTDGVDKVTMGGFTGKVLLLPGVDERAARERQAPFYQQRDPKGGVALVLGAGNVSSIPPMDLLYKMFVDGRTTVLKMNPVNEYVGPILERAFAPLVDRGYLAVVYGGGDVGQHLVDHPAVEEIHITGSDKTHDLIVWGPAGPEQERRKRSGDPILHKTITSELGNVTPVMVVPGSYSDDELWFMARNVASMVGNNGSFNCNAAKMLVTASGWAQAGRFQELLARALAALPLRKAYYPGAHDRYETLLRGRENVLRFGQPGPGSDALAWAFVPGLDPADPADALFRVEPFCGILSQTALPANDPAEFLAAATRFCNERLWGTLSCTVMVSPATEADPQVALALDRAVLDLRYGTVAINHWSALGYGFVSTPWGGHPSATLPDIQSGLGWVHNTFMLEGIEKGVVRGPLTVSPKPPWFYDNAVGDKVGRKMVSLEASPSWLKVPGLAMTAMKG